MDIEKLLLLRKPWLRVDTWHTGHPMDDQRFHSALKAVFDELSVQISPDDFRKTIAACLKEHRPGDVGALESDIEEFRQRGESIASYLFDLQPRSTQSRTVLCTTISRRPRNHYKLLIQKEKRLFL
jgi:hypothetical protein